LDFGEGHVQKRLQRHGRRRAGGVRGTRPNDVQDDVRKRRISIMLVPAPVARNQIDFNIPGARLVLAKLHDGPAKIRAALLAPKARMQNAQGLAVCCAEVVAAQALVMPDSLEQVFRRMGGMRLGQLPPGLLFRAPLGVKVRAGLWHNGC
jgi:hypothetical protein